MTPQELISLLFVLPPWLPAVVLEFAPLRWRVVRIP